MNAVPQQEVGTLQSFDTEAAAVDFVVNCLWPFCKIIEREPVFKNGLRPDLGIRLSALPHIPLCVEIKKFTNGKINPLPEAIAQASDYARMTEHAAFIAPLVGRSVTRFTWQSSPVGAALLVAGQFNVGGIYFSPQDTRYGGMILAGVGIAQFSVDSYGDPCTTLHSQAEHMIKMKVRSGSQAWRS